MWQFSTLSLTLFSIISAITLAEASSIHRNRRFIFDAAAPTTTPATTAAVPISADTTDAITSVTEAVTVGGVAATGAATIPRDATAAPGAETVPPAIGGTDVTPDVATAGTGIVAATTTIVGATAAPGIATVGTGVVDTTTVVVGDTAAPGVQTIGTGVDSIGDLRTQSADTTERVPTVTGSNIPENPTTTAGVVTKDVTGPRTDVTGSVSALSTVTRTSLPESVPTIPNNVVTIKSSDTLSNTETTSKIPVRTESHTKPSDQTQPQTISSKPATQSSITQKTASPTIVNYPTEEDNEIVVPPPLVANWDFWGNSPPVNPDLGIILPPNVGERGGFGAPPPGSIGSNFLQPPPFPPLGYGNGGLMYPPPPGNGIGGPFPPGRFGRDVHQRRSRRDLSYKKIQLHPWDNPWDQPSKRFVRQTGTYDPFSGYDSKRDRPVSSLHSPSGLNYASAGGVTTSPLSSSLRPPLAINYDPFASSQTNSPHRVYNNIASDVLYSSGVRNPSQVNPWETTVHTSYATRRDPQQSPYNNDRHFVYDGHKGDDRYAFGGSRLTPYNSPRDQYYREYDNSGFGSRLSDDPRDKATYNYNSYLLNKFGTNGDSSFSRSHHLEYAPLLSQPSSLIVPSTNYQSASSSDFHGNSVQHGSGLGGTEFDAHQNPIASGKPAPWSVRIGTRVQVQDDEQSRRKGLHYVHSELQPSVVPRGNFDGRESRLFNK